VRERRIELLRPVWCCAVQAHITCVTNPEGEVVGILCAERRDDARTCRAKAHALQEGLIGDLLRPAAADLGPASRCTLG
jgi:hypothetical protein